jgi:hypothetical protein
MILEDPVLSRMQDLSARWEAGGDRRSVFLGCYALMTRNMLSSLQGGEFSDPPWVHRLLEHFAGYYFAALESHESAPTAAPPVWQAAFASCAQPRASAAQQLLLGVNAHINFDLVLALVDLLEPEWPRLDNAGRSQRFADYAQVNAIIAATIDAVQDTILEPAMPAMQLLDVLMGPVDELLVARLIRSWRQSVWEAATRLLEAGEPEARTRLISQVEQHALQVARWIGEI